MKRVVKEGDKSKAVCHKCKKVVTTTFEVLDLETKEDGKDITVPNILVACCDECSTTVSIPAQEFSKIKKAILESLHN